MRRTSLAPLAASLVGIPAALHGGLPGWSLSLLVGVVVLLVATEALVTQVIRLRASKRITRSQDALRVLEIEGHYHRRQR
jgi:hypothetical protein